MKINIEALTRLTQQKIPVVGCFTKESLATAAPKVAQEAKDFTNQICDISVKSLAEGVRVNCKIPRGRSYKFKSTEGINVNFIDNITIDSFLTKFPDYRVEDGVVTYNPQSVADSVDGLSQDILHILLLDRSSSMGADPEGNDWYAPEHISRWGILKQAMSRKHEAIVESSKTYENQRHQISVIFFDSTIDACTQPVDADDLTMKGIFRGPSPQYMTALYDALAYALDTSETYLQLGKRVVLEVFTDGDDTKSTNNSLSSVRAKLSRIEQDPNFTFALAGVGTMFAWFAKQLQIADGNFQEVEPTVEGFNRYSQKTRSASMNYSKNVFAGVSTTTDYFQFDEE